MTLFEATMNYDGNLIAFMSYATNIGGGDSATKGQLYVRDTDYGETIMVSTNSDGQPGNMKSEMPRLSADGNFIAFYSLASNLVAQDTNGLSDIFVKNLNTGEVRIASRAISVQAMARAWMWPYQVMETWLRLSPMHQTWFQMIPTANRTPLSTTGIRARSSGSA